MSVGGRRARGEGGVYQRKDGRWCGSVDLGLVGGKRRRKIVYGRTKKEAAEKLYDARKEADAGRLVLPAKVTVGEYLDHWLEHVARPLIRDTTHDSYDVAIRNHLKPRVGDLQLAKLNVLGLQRSSGRRARLLRAGSTNASNATTRPASPGPRLAPPAVSSPREAGGAPSTIGASPASWRPPASGRGRSARDPGGGGAEG